MGQTMNFLSTTTVDQPSGTQAHPQRSRLKPARRKTRRLSLALQGGGALGAFTWGVLDRLLEEEHISFDAVSGASAGAMNAVLLASGLAQGSPEEARVSLERFWRKVSKAGQLSRLASSNATLTAMAPRLSPYEFNPLDLNPLREILAGEVDFDAVRTDAPVRLLLGTTRVSDGALRIFRTEEVTEDVVLASACLPHLHHAVTIDGEAYWDGGYAANPPLIPLVTATKASDVLVVQIVPSNGSELPTTSSEIDKRLNQITFSSSLQKDLEALTMMTKLSQAEREPSNSRLGRKLQRLQLHRIAAEDHVNGLSGSKFTDTDWAFLLHLRDQGRAAADTWLLSQSLDLAPTQSA
jgi:NTE family protein